MLISGLFFKLIQRIFTHFFFSRQTGVGAKTYAFSMSVGIEKTNHWLEKYSQVTFKLHNWWPEIAAAGEARCRRRRQLASWRRRRPSGADQQPLSLQPPAAWTASREEAATSAPRHLLTPVLSSHLLSCPAPALAGGETSGILSNNLSMRLPTSSACKCSRSNWWWQKSMKKLVILLVHCTDAMAWMDLLSVGNSRPNQQKWHHIHQGGTYTAERKNTSRSKQ